MLNTLYFLFVACLLPYLICLAACTDLTSYKIYNWHNLLIILLFMPCALFLQLSLDQFLNHALGFGAVLCAGILMFALRWLGGGDVKFAAAIALWFGYGVNLGDFLVMSMMFGGGLTLGLLQFRAYTLPNFLAKYQWVQALHAPKGDVPYGIALAAGALWVLPTTFWFEPFLK